MLRSDQIALLVGGSDMVFFTEDGGRNAGVHARDSSGNFFTILSSTEYDDETTGLQFSPDNKFMYLAYQHEGLLFEIKRLDGKSFSGQTLDIKYHGDPSVSLAGCPAVETPLSYSLTFLPILLCRTSLPSTGRDVPI